MYIYLYIFIYIYKYIYIYRYIYIYIYIILYYTLAQHNSIIDVCLGIMYVSEKSSLRCRKTIFTSTVQKTRKKVFGRYIVFKFHVFTKRTSESAGVFRAYFRNGIY